MHLHLCRELPKKNSECYLTSSILQSELKVDDGKPSTFLLSTESCDSKNPKMVV